MIVTSFNHPKGNADTERVVRTLKEDFWLGDWDFIEKVKKDIEKMLELYNKNYPHSSIGYKTPYEFDILSKKPCFSIKIQQKSNQKSQLKSLDLTSGRQWTISGSNCREWARILVEAGAER